MPPRLSSSQPISGRLRIQAAAKLALDHDGVQSCGAELAIEVSKLCRAHRLVQHLPDDLLLGHSEQRGVF